MIHGTPGKPSRGGYKEKTSTGAHIEIKKAEHASVATVLR